MAIFIGFTIYTQPSKEELAAAKQKQDSIALVEQQKKAITLKLKDTATLAATSPKNDSLVGDSAIKSPLTAAVDTEKLVTLENEVMKLTLTSKGGRVKQVILKKHTDYAGKPLSLFDGDDNRFGLSFFENNRVVNTGELQFNALGSPVNVQGKDSTSFAMRLEVSPEKYLEYVYTLKGDEYLVGFKINFVGLNDVIEQRSNSLDLEWLVNQPQLEKSITNERAASTAYWQFADNETDYINEGKSEKQVIQNKLNWVAFKQQFFSSVFVAKNAIDKPITLETQMQDSSKYVKTISAAFPIPYGHKPSESFNAAFYFGPNHYKTLSKYELQSLVPLGWSFLGWINRWLVIPVFDFLQGMNISYGIIILLLTIIVKVLLLPLNYKSYMSGARMRVLKPEVEELNKKFEKKDPLEKQQATMALYRKAGVNPMGGCLPMLLQLPITLAVFRFFPASFELRHQSFLWADDLSSYDSIFQLPFSIWGYGDHVSLFAILMAITTVLYSMVNMQMQPSGDDMMAKQMKIMMYIMPVIFLGVMNSQSSGLCYYYTLGNLLTFGQQYAFKFLVDEKAIRAKIEENKKKPVTKSNFQKKLEDMAKQKGYKLPK